MTPKLTLLGTGTSQGVPVIGCHCPTCRSTDPRDHRLRTAALLDFPQAAGPPFRLQIDAGPDLRTQLLRARVATLDAVLLTHEHADHTNGLDDLRPLIFRQQREMPVYCLPRVAEDLRTRFAYAFSDYPGVPKLDIREVEFGEVVRIGGYAFTMLEVHHGALPILGFRVGDLAYLTDVKTLPEETMAALAGTERLVLSCLNRVGTHSHLSLGEALGIAGRVGAGRTVLTHCSHKLGRYGEVVHDLPGGVELGYDGVGV